MSDTMTLRDHDKACQHGWKMSHFAPICPGGKEIILRKQRLKLQGGQTAIVWVEADDA